MKIKLTLLAGVLLPVLLFTGCWDEPDGSDLVTDQLASISSYDKNTNFGQYKTFYIPDFIVQVTESGTQWQHIDNDAAKNVLNEITLNLENAGYQKVDNSASADLIMNVAWTEITNVVVGYPWWWDYWGYWGYDWYYPYYPYYPVAVVGSYDVGLLMMELAQNKPDNTGKYPIEWMGYVRGIEYVTVHSNAEINSAIDDCFKQNPAFSKK